MDKSMEKIDIIKLLIYLMVFICIVLFMVLVMIIPNIKDYRAAKKVYSTANVHKMRVQSVLDDRQNELATLKEENRRAILSFAHDFSTEHFIQYAQNFFSNVSLEKVEKKAYKEDFSEYELKVSSQLESPTNFYSFLEGLNRYDNIVQADFPIHMEANASNIDSRFMIKVYDINSSK